MSQDIQLSPAYRQHIGASIKAYRGVISLTQQAFANHVGVSAQSVGNAERGSTTVSPALLEKIAVKAGVPFNPADPVKKATADPVTSHPCEIEAKNGHTPVIWDPLTFKIPLERHFITQYKGKSEIILVPYAGINRDHFKESSQHMLLCREKSYQKQDILFIVRACDWEVVKPFCQRRNSVKEQALKPEAGLAKQLNTAEYLTPYVFRRKPLPVKVVLRNGVVITCKLLRYDKYQVLALVKKTEQEKALILIYKHGILKVEPVNPSEVKNRR